MKKIEDIKTPKTIEEFRYNLKKYCLGSNDNIFIYNRISGKQYKIEINKLYKISDVFHFIKDPNILGLNARECTIVLMCDISNISLADLMMKQEEAIKSLREVYLFNNQDSQERSNFLNSTNNAIEKIVSGEKIIDAIDAKPKQTPMKLDVLSELYFHLFGKYFDTVGSAKMKYNLSKYN